MDEKEFKAKEEEYKTLKKQRVELQKKIKSLVAECNDLIKKENEAVEVRDKCLKKYDNSYRQKRIHETMRTRGRKVQEFYTESLKIKAKCIDQINAKYDKFWA